MMWDLSGGHNQNYPHTSRRRTPSPAFPSPQYASATFAPASYPGSTSYVPTPSLPVASPLLNPSPQHYPQRMSPIPRGQVYQPAPQVIIIKHSHRHHRRPRAHSHSHQHSQPIVIPQPVTHSNSHPSPYAAPTTAYPQPQYYPGSHHPSSSAGHIAPPPVGLHQQYNQQHHQQPLSTPMAPAPHLSGEFQYSKCTGRKKALCIGINYRGQENELRGCINDAKNMRRFLISKYGYRNEDIVLLTDDTSNPRHLPTRQNMIDAMKWLVRSARPHDSLFFHYSGHGGQVEDRDGDEVDGFDEVIFPLDFKQHGEITDDEMHAIMAAPLPRGCRLTALFDSCHSGTVLDLPYIYSSHGRLKGEHVRAPARKRKATLGDVISWSGCKDGQTSADTFHGGVAVGAMSYAFVQSLTDKPNQSYRELLRSVRLILQPKFSQTPQLGSSHHIDTALRFII